jgi:hypothetical protein
MADRPTTNLSNTKKKGGKNKKEKSPNKDEKKQTNK